MFCALVHGLILHFLRRSRYTQPMYALIPNKDTLFALASLQRKLATAFSEHFAPHLVACPTYPLWALTPSPLPPVISSCRILAPRLLHEAGVIAFPVELVSPCGTSSPSAHASPADTSEPPLSALGEGSQLCAPVAPAVWEGCHQRSVDTQEGRVWQLSIVAACVLQGSAHWGIAHGLRLGWQPSECSPFPRSERVFRVAQVELEGTSWHLVHSRWCKIK